jgi:hypothetical protein
MEVLQMSEVNAEARRVQLDRIGLELTQGVERQIRRRRVLRTRVIAGFLAVGAICAATVSGLTVNGSDTASPAAAQVLQKAARAAGFTPGPIPPGRYLYTERVGILQFRVTDPRSGLAYTYEFRRTGAEWVGHDYSVLVVVPNQSQQPQFPTAQDRANWEAAGSPPLKSPFAGEGFERTMPPGSYRDALLVWTFDPAPGKDLLGVYGLTGNELSAGASSQGRFNRLVRRHVRGVTKRLSRRGASTAQIERDTDRATFSLVLQLVGHSRVSQSPRVRAALLNLAGTLRNMSVDPGFTDRLGRRGVAVRQTQSYDLVVFDPDTFVINELHLKTKPLASPKPGEPVPTAAINDFRYAFVDHQRELPPEATP